jgi:hypothetical protein
VAHDITAQLPEPSQVSVAWLVLHGTQEALEHPCVGSSGAHTAPHGFIPVPQLRVPDELVLDVELALEVELDAVIPPWPTAVPPPPWPPEPPLPPDELVEPDAEDETGRPPVERAQAPDKPREHPRTVNQMRRSLLISTLFP